MKQIFINFLALGSLLSSVLVITSKNPVIAVIFLIAVFCNAAGYLILLGIGFIGIAYILVYVGAITVLFLFTIMMINIKLSDIVETGKLYTRNIPLATLISLLFIYELFTIMPFTFNNVSVLSHLLNYLNNLNVLLLIDFADLSLYNVVFSTINPIVTDTTFTNFTQIQSIGFNLYTIGSVLLIITSLILLLAMISPIFITKKNDSNNPLSKISKGGLGYKKSDVNRHNGTLKRGYHTTSQLANNKKSKNLADSPNILTKLDPWFVTGLTDAEGCFSVSIIKRVGRALGYEFKPRFNILMHYRELDLLYSVQNFFGVGHVHYKPGNKSASFEVAARADIMLILDHFKKYPLQSSKRNSLYIFSVVFEMFCKNEHKIINGLKTMVAYINLLNRPIEPIRLEKITNDFGPLPFLALPPVPVLSSIILPNPWWIVGFILGDGSFSYSSYTATLANGTKRIVYNFILTINQLKVDTFLLKSIAIFLGCGVIYSNTSSTKSEVRFYSQPINLHIIIPFFNKYPLIGYKLEQFKLWEEAILIQIGQPKSSLTKHQDLANLVKKLNDLNGYLRTYK